MQVGTVQVGTAQVGRAQVGMAQVDTVQVSTAQVGTVQVGIVQVGIVQAVESMLFEDGFDVFAFEDAVWCGDFHCGSLTCWRCAPRPDEWMGLSGWYRTRTRKRVPCRRSEQYPYYGYW